MKEEVKLKKKKKKKIGQKVNVEFDSINFDDGIEVLEVEDRSK